MPGETHDAARRALAAVPINVGFARAVLDGTAAGELWCDDPARPRAFHAIHPYGMSLVWGDGVGDAFGRIVARVHALRERGADQWIQVEPRWQHLDWDRALEAVPLDAVEQGSSCVTVRHVRVNFAFDADGSGARPAPEPRDAGWSSRRATAGDFPVPGSVVPSAFWPDATAFLKHGGGVVVEKDGQVGAIAFASYRWDDHVEIGIETLPAFRRRGLAAAAAAGMVEAVLDAGLTPVWSCRAENVGSYRLAERVGFRPTAHLPYFRVRGA